MPLLDILIKNIEALKKEEYIKQNPISSPPTVCALQEIFNISCQVPYQGQVSPIKKEEEMITATIDSGSEQAKSHLRVRARSIKDQKIYDLQREFGLRDDTDPRSANELITRIKEGKYTIRPDRGDTENYSHGLEYIRWRDPAKVEDKAGYKLAEEALTKQYIATKDTIIVMEPKDGLAAIQAFESATIH